MIFMRLNFRNLLSTGLLFLAINAVKAQTISQEDLYKDLPFEMPRVQEPSIPNNAVNIKDFGAIADGITSNTKAIAAAIEEVVKKGGGRVVIPEGVWVTGPIILKSKIDLHIEKGAIVRFSGNYDEYPLIYTSYEGLDAWRTMSPIYAENVNDVAITGQGIVDGNGGAWRPVKQWLVNEDHWKRTIASGGFISPKGTSWYPTQEALNGSQMRSHSKLSKEECEKIKVFLRPTLLKITNCQRLLIDGPTFLNPPAWTLHPLMCQDVIVRNVTVANESWMVNTDALDLESCKNALVYNCVFDAGDDGICMKSGKDEDGRKRNMATENVIVYGCKVLQGHGGFVVGSEMSGGVRNVKVSHCSFAGTEAGLRFKSTRGRGGIVENVYVSDIQMTDIEKDAILFDMYYALSANTNKVEVPVNEGTPQFRNIYMKNIVCKGANRAVFLQGLPEMSLKNIGIENVTIEAQQGLTCTDAEQIILKNITLQIKDSLGILGDNAQNVTFDRFQCNQNAAYFTGTSTSNVIFRNGSIGTKNIKTDKSVHSDAILVK
jgi:polygalacturonase